MTAETPALLLTILSAAVFGSWHCAAMCGPIAAAIANKGSIWPYHLGRGISYMGAGALIGSVGQNILFSERLAPKILLGLFLSAYFIHSFVWPLKQLAPPGMGRLYRFLVNSKTGGGVLGLCSVLLPCAWLWTFLAAAAATGSPYSGALILFVLWISSLPALSAIHFYFVKGLSKASPQKTIWIRRTLTVAGMYALVSHLFFKF
ncbi:MAG: sulfite exporter TauE/SafE family protein [Bdellovibrio sp.]|jgi:sulfite exporter TauE/SafE